MKKLFLVCLAPVLFASASIASDTALTLIDFETRAETNLWRAVNDGVMGGRSSGGPVFETDKLIFSGVINTNGGGFSSIRRPVQPGEMQSAKAVTMRVKSDGRAYRLRFRTNVTYRGRRIAFQKPLPVAKAGEWQIVTVTLDNMRASLFGRTITGASFVPADIIETGFILADGQDGPFRFEVNWMRIE